MEERERNKRLLLLDKLVGSKDLQSIELIETMVANDTPSIQKSFQIVKDSGNFNFVVCEHRSSSSWGRLATCLDCGHEWIRESYD